MRTRARPRLRKRPLRTSPISRPTHTATEASSIVNDGSEPAVSSEGWSRRVAPVAQRAVPAADPSNGSPPGPMR